MWKRRASLTGLMVGLCTIPALAQQGDTFSSGDTPAPLQGQAVITAPLSGGVSGVGAVKCYAGSFPSPMEAKTTIFVNIYSYPHNITNITLGQANNNFPVSQLFDQATGFVTNDSLGAPEVHITQLHYRPQPQSELVTSGSDTMDVNIILTLYNSWYTLKEVTCHGASSKPNRAKLKTKPRAKVSSSTQDCWALQQSIQQEAQHLALLGDGQALKRLEATKGQEVRDCWQAHFANGGYGRNSPYDTGRPVPSRPASSPGLCGYGARC